ncbi:hypothetical protein [Bacillus luti]
MAKWLFWICLLSALFLFCYFNNSVMMYEMAPTPADNFNVWV